MSEIDINYKGSKIAGMDASGTKTLLTEGKYCEDDIEIVYTRPSGGSPNLQTKNKTYTPSASQQTEQVAPDNGYDGLDKVNVTVNAIPSQYIIPTGKKTITANANDIDVAQYEKVDVNVPTSGGGLTLLATKALGTINTSSTTATDTGQTLEVSGINDYDLLIVETSVDTKTNNRHAATIQTIWLNASSNVRTKNGATIATATQNDKLSSSGVLSSRANTTKYGIYVNSASTPSGGKTTLAFYQRYNSTQTGTINGSYTVRVYGVKLAELISG